ncbi:FecR domain-containing protein [Labrys sp. KB_33_2]|uniref:FecR family protein n=1 Tax=unclassified Labrys (in: a-proteobacteria) TaxID=2688601 RepID=UPI003EC0EB86
MDPGTTRRQADLALSDAAIDWLVKLHSGRAGKADHEAFAAWRKQSSEHELAAREAETIWHGIGIAGKKVQRSARAKLTRRAVLGGVAIGGLAVAGSSLLRPHLFAEHSTGAGERSTITLPDGSTALLNGDSALDVAFDAGQRRLQLLNGQALFQVMPDAGRPFIVTANGGQARAVGTVFDVDIRSHEVVVTVVEGRVDVMAGTRPGSGVLAAADQRVRYGADRQPSPAEPVDAESETAWRRGKLIFNRRPLGDVVVEIERQRRGRIMIASARLQSLEVTGVFDLADPESILSTIEATLPVKVTRLPFVTILH